MGTAKFLGEINIYMGPCQYFRVDPPLRDPLNNVTTDHVAVVGMALGGPRVEVFACDEHGLPQRMTMLPGSFVLQHEVSLNDASTWALATAGGYEIDWEEQNGSDESSAGGHESGPEGSDLHRSPGEEAGDPDSERDEVPDAPGDADGAGVGGTEH